MNQPDKIKSIEVRSRKRRRTRGAKASGGVQVSMLKAKKSSIPTPEQKVDTTDNVVKWGKNNEYRYFINYLFRKNPIHSGIIRAKQFFSTSKGLKYEGPDGIKWEAFNKNHKKSHLDKTVEDIMDDISLDFEKSNMFAFKVSFSKLDLKKGLKTYRKLKRIPFEKIAFEIEKDDEGNEYLNGNIQISDDWLDSKCERKRLEPFKRDDMTQHECYVLFKEESGQSIETPDDRSVNPGVYPDPPYGGAITDIDTRIQVGVYNNAEIHNGFSIGTLIYLANGRIKNEKKKRDLEADLGASTTGPLQSGGSMVIYGNGQNEKPVIENLNGNNLPERYTNVKKGSEESTVQGHLFTSPTLAGIKTEGSLGDSKELKTAYSILKQNYIAGRQKAMLSVINWIMNELAGIQGKVSFNEIPLELPEDENQNQPQFQINMAGDGKPIDIILERLKRSGRPKSDFRVLQEFSMEEGEKTKDELISLVKKEFAELSSDHLKALGLIGNDTEFEEIRTALDLSTNELEKIYRDLVDEKLITKGGKITDAGKRQVAIAEVESIEVMYEYRLRPNAPDLVPGGKSREFCQELMSLGRLYSRADINLISGVEGYDVFAYRGGWYHNPNTGKNEPGCRHEWAQVIVFN